MQLPEIKMRSTTKKMRAADNLHGVGLDRVITRNRPKIAERKSRFPYLCVQALT